MLVFNDGLIVVFINRILYLKVKYKILDLDSILKKLFENELVFFCLINCWILDYRFCVGFCVQILCSDFVFRFCVGERFG